MCGEQRLEQLAVVTDPQVQEFVHDDRVLKPNRLTGQFDSEGYGPAM